MKKAFFALYCAYAARYLTSFFSLPFLARELGPVGLGDLAVATSMVMVVSIWVEYGFSVSALREISAAKPDDRGGIVIGVTTAKLVLWGVAGLTLGALKLFFPPISHFPADLGLVVLLGGVQAFNLGWYFLGVGRASVSAVIDGLGALMWFIPAFFLVRSPSDVNLVLICQLGSQAVLVLIAHGIIFTSLKRFSVDWVKVIEQVKSGGPLFFKKIAMAAHSAAIVLILGAMAGPVQVGYFNAADRFAGAIVASFYPAAQAVMPYLFNRAATDGSDSIFTASRYMSIILLIASIIITTSIYFTAHILIAVLAGPQYTPSIQILQILAFTFPLVAINQALGLYIMLPLRLDVGFLAGVILGECASLILTYIWASSLGAVGVASFRVIEAAISAIVFSIVLYKKRYIQKLLFGRSGSKAIPAAHR
ncbi:oligosaccharide flippase family protein [Methylocella tundrae]|uniref:Polysaccharide biosynthesis protein n=1 Tax=Methylocella tundrae TaxID=227605 RepID=A0A4U8Z1Z3_METTU|nr:oligosaccharide flippase family protein [Methylocella tundrae]WPP03301.1 oligosaccharide flippase family protein [Methylocella tundrae]VFU09334.1 membrane protein of unknown function [Methylocella tundrae]